MKRLFVYAVVAAVLAVSPIGVKANTNQAAAEKIAARLAEKFPGYDIAVSYHNGKVRLAGMVGSQEMVERATSQVRQVPGVKVSDVDGSLLRHGAAVVGSNPIANAPRPKAMPNEMQAALPQAAQQGKVEQVAMRNAQRQVQNSAAYAQITQPYGAEASAAPTAQPNGMMQGQQTGQYPQMSQQQMMMIQQQMMQQQMMQSQMQPQQHLQPVPGQYNQPNMPEYAWPAYAAYPNYAEVCYPKQYSPKAWPYIGPFYPYPQTPLGWRKVTLEWHDGWWWMDFDDGSFEGPFSPLFRQPTRYTY